MEPRNKIIDKIISVYENQNQIEIKNIKLEFSANKYSSTKENVWHLVLNDKVLSRKDKYTFKYACVTCDTYHMVGTIQFLRKINKCSHCCYLCRNKTLTKREEQAKFMQNNAISRNDMMKQESIIVIKTNLDIINDSINVFNTFDDDFQTNYFAHHLTGDDYMRISKNITSLQNGKYTNLDSIQYVPVFKTNNQMIFTSIMYDTINNILFKAHQPIMKCDNCENNWRAKSLEKFKNSIRIICHNCSLVNKTFKIRTTKNINNDTILYQSKIELKLIDWCNDNNILIQNGPNIKYNFEGKDRIYKVDFVIKKTLIEIKDNHIWHKRDVESGKLLAKESGVNILIENKEYDNYFLINPKNWNYYLDKLNKI